MLAAVLCVAVNHDYEKSFMPDYSFILPADFLDYEFEVQAKGWFSEATLSISGKIYRLNFYDVVRLNQDIEDELAGVGVFFEPNVIIVSTVTKVSMERAVELLIDSGRLVSLVPE